MATIFVPKGRKTFYITYYKNGKPIRKNTCIPFNEPRAAKNLKKEIEKNTLILNGWLADYPDPDNFLRQSDALSQLHRLGWQDATYDRLVEEASRTPDRLKRMAMYRQADRLLVAEQILVLPIFYFIGSELVKPWVKRQPVNLLGWTEFHKIIVEEH